MPKKHIIYPKKRISKSKRSPKKRISKKRVSKSKHSPKNRVSKKRSNKKRISKSKRSPKKRVSKSKRSNKKRISKSKRSPKKRISKSKRSPNTTFLKDLNNLKTAYNYMKKSYNNFKKQKGGSIQDVTSSENNFNKAKSNYEAAFKTFETIAKGLYTDYANYVIKIDELNKQLGDMVTEDEKKRLQRPDIKGLKKYKQFSDNNRQISDSIDAYTKAENEYLKKQVTDPDYLQKNYMGSAISTLGKLGSVFMPKTTEAKQAEIQRQFEQVTSST
jgi:hypothetical protein